MTPSSLHRSWRLLALSLLPFASPWPQLVAAPEAEPTAGVTVEATLAAEPAAETPAARDARMRWWREAKFGLFIHWGVYAVPAGKYGDKNTYGEWIMHSAKIPVAEYRGFAAKFNPVKYDPTLWAEIARDAGMRYLVITSKHHDGFALYPSAATSWDIADATPYKRDLLGPLVEASQKKGLKIGFYYSQAQDWMHAGGAKAGFQEGGGWDETHKGSFDDYLKSVAVPQVSEILSQYPIDILWWDTPTWMNAARTKSLASLTKLRPGLITNNRLGTGFGGDTATPEQFVPVTGIKGDWETCMTMNGHWGYNAADERWKSSADLIRKLADICAKGGNFLLNVGPTAEGEFPAACVERLRDMGRWLRANGESIYGTSAGPFAHLSWGVATRKADKLYLHVFDWPSDGKLRVPLKNKAKAAWLVGAPDKKLFVTEEGERLVISVPAQAPDAVDSVVVLEIAGEPLVQPLPSVGAKATASASQEGSEAANALDGTGALRWRAPLELKSASLEIDLGRPVELNGIGCDEPDVWPRLRQNYVVEGLGSAGWVKLTEGVSEGHGFKTAFGQVKLQKVRITLECAKGAPGLAEVQLYRPE